jgi:hypothetical protein
MPYPSLLSVPFRRDGIESQLDFYFPFLYEIAFRDLNGAASLHLVNAPDEDAARKNIGGPVWPPGVFWQQLDARPLSVRRSLNRLIDEKYDTLRLFQPSEATLSGIARPAFTVVTLEQEAIPREVYRRLIQLGLDSFMSNKKRGLNDVLWLTRDKTPAPKPRGVIIPIARGRKATTEPSRPDECHPKPGKVLILPLSRS